MEMKEGGYGRYGAGLVDMSGNKWKEKIVSGKISLAIILGRY
jgi:hypothetical protein